jgi:hypothetical protein
MYNRHNFGDSIPNYLNQARCENYFAALKSNLQSLASVLEKETQADPTRKKKFLSEIWGFWDGSSSVPLEECSLLGNDNLNSLVRKLFAFEVSKLSYWSRECKRPCK